MTYDKDLVPVSEHPTALTVGDRMQAMGITTKDLVISRLMLMQPTSEQVGEDKAKTGDIINTETSEVVGGVEKGVEIIPLSLYKTLLTEDMSVKPPKFLKQEALTSHLESLPWEGHENNHEGVEIPVKRTVCFNFFCLLSSDIEKEEASPMIIRFKSSSMYAGKLLATHMFKRAQLGQAPYSQAVKIGSKKEKKDTNTYAVFTVGEKRKSTEAEIKAAEMWFPSLDAMKVKVNEVVDSEEKPQARHVVAEQDAGFGPKF